MTRMIVEFGRQRLGRRAGRLDQREGARLLFSFSWDVVGEPTRAVVGALLENCSRASVTMATPQFSRHRMQFSSMLPLAWRGVHSHRF